jgi:DNA repair exonuclease SbcCD ATPase subunit
MSSPQQPTYIIPPPSAPNWKTPVLVGALVLLGASNIYQYVQLDRVRTDTTNEMKKLNDTFTGTLAQMRLDSSEEMQRSRRTMADLQNRLADQRRAAAMAVGQAKIDAEQKVEKLQAKVDQEAAAQQKALSEVKQTAETATTQVAAVNTDVTNVKADLGNTKTQLETTIANLKRAQGDLDSHSSLIATNSTELKALRELGERNYTEFNITKGKQFTRVADVMVELKKADPKHNKFTIAITADDITVDKKDRNTNEPIQFLTKKAAQPYEIVVNKVSKDQIAGYLATPKVSRARGGS